MFRPPNILRRFHLLLRHQAIALDVHFEEVDNHLYYDGIFNDHPLLPPPKGRATLAIPQRSRGVKIILFYQFEIPI